MNESVKASVWPVTSSEKVESRLIVKGSAVICETADGSDSSKNEPVPIGVDVNDVVWVSIPDVVFGEVGIVTVSVVVDNVDIVTLDTVDEGSGVAVDVVVVIDCDIA